MGLRCPYCGREGKVPAGVTALPPTVRCPGCRNTFPTDPAEQAEAPDDPGGASASLTFWKGTIRDGAAGLGASAAPDVAPASPSPPVAAVLRPVPPPASDDLDRVIKRLDRLISLSGEIRDRLFYVNLIAYVVVVCAAISLVLGGFSLFIAILSAT
jgi:hypothetical protein